MLVILAASLALAACDAKADDKIDCDKALTQHDMNFCAAEDYKAADSMLNVTYRALQATLDKKTQDMLKDAQRAWIKFRDEECHYQASPNEGGSLWPLVYHGCLTDLTKARTKELAPPR